MSKTLAEIEMELDKRAQSLTILSLPLRSVLGHIYIIIDTLLHGNRLQSGLARPQAGKALVSRLSYLLPLLLTKCDVEQVGANAADALGIMTPQHFSELAFLLQYGQFCELMPAVHRNWYQVQETASNSYAIAHISPAIARFELQDIVLSETAMPQEPEINVARYRSAIADLATNAPRLNLSLISSVVGSLKDDYLQGDCERPGISEKGFQEATGVAFEMFRRFRAGWAAYSICSLLISEQLMVRAGTASHGEQERMLTEAWEWLMPFLDSKFIDGLMHATTGVPFDDYDKLMRFYVVDAKDRIAAQAGDGFFPPITKIGGGYLFSADIVRATMSTRNILYAENKLDPALFSRVAANEMEPALVTAAVNIFRQLPQVVVVPNVQWEKGEIDIFVFSPEENAALHVQAKAAIPPEGARMTKAMETRIAEALSQLERLRGMPAADIDRLCSRVLNREVRGVAIHDVVLSSSCFGTSLVWHRMGGVGAVNLPLLTAVVDKHRRENERRPIARFTSTSVEILDRWCVDVTPGWTSESTTFEGLTLEVPSLELDSRRLWAIRQASQNAL